MNTFDITFTAGQTVHLPGGHQFHILDADLALSLVFYGPNNQRLESGSGLKAPFRTQFKERFLGVDVTSASSQTVKLGITDGDAQYMRNAGDVDADISAATFEHLTTITIATVTSALIAAANSDRKEIVITALSSNPDTVYLGGSGVGDEQGIPLEPGDDYALTTRGAIYGYNSGASDAKMLIAEME